MQLPLTSHWRNAGEGPICRFLIRLCLNRLLSLSLSLSLSFSRQCLCLCQLVALLQRLSAVPTGSPLPGGDVAVYVFMT